MANSKTVGRKAVWVRLPPSALVSNCPSPITIIPIIVVQDQRQVWRVVCWGMALLTTAFLPVSNVVAQSTEANFLLLQYSLYAPMILITSGLILAILRTLLRSAGWDLVLGFRRLQPRYDYPPDWDRVRRVVLQRDGYRCQNCSSDDQLHVHHIVPLTSGGTNAWSNLVTLCPDCHGRLHPHMRGD
jgi:5-methylcytosine-specific restriction endonuclease McrA